MIRKFFFSLLIFSCLVGCSQLDDFFEERSNLLVDYKYQYLIFNGVFPGVFNIETVGVVDYETDLTNTSFVVYKTPNEKTDIIEMGDEIFFEYSIVQSKVVTDFVDSGSGSALFTVDNFPQVIINGLLGAQEKSRVVIINKAEEIYKLIPHNDLVISEDVLVFQFDITSIIKSKN